jgi:error-prone DNA polymerase
MLTAIRKSFSLIKQYYQHDYSIPFITALPDDPQVFKQIQEADTVGVFQIESRAQMSMLPRLKPKKYYDLVVQIAIVRPGPIQGDMVHPYLRRRDGKEHVEYPSPEVKKILERTMGVPIFQEQVIQLAMVAAGFTGGEADGLRRAMASWKKNGDLNKFKQKLTDGMTQRGYSYDYAMRLFEQICGFGEYGFPESHSASFAVLAYVSAWLKHYYPEAFYVGLLNSLPMGFYSASQIIQDAKQHHVNVLGFCVNKSNYDHSLQGSMSSIKDASKLGVNNTDLCIRMGLRLIKGLKSESINTVVKHRPIGGYQSIDQIRQLAIPSPCLQALASANAFSSMADNRYQARWELMDSVMELPLFAQHTSANDSYAKQPSLFDNLVEDYASTGLSIDLHPIALLRQANLLPKFYTADTLVDVPHQTLVSVVGVVTGKQSPGTAAGVTFITLEDHTGNISVVVWQSSAREQKKAYMNAKILQIKGILERGDGGVIHVIAGRLIDQTHLLAQLDTKTREFR